MISETTDLTVEYITLVVYLIMLLALGGVFARLNKNLSDFVRAGAQGAWWMVGSSMLMAGISAFTFTGNASAAFMAGPSVLIYYIANCTAFFICFLFLAAWFRQTRAYTRADIVRDRFGGRTEQFIVYSSVVLQPIGAGVQLWALAVFASSVFGFSLQGTIAVVGWIVVFYSTSGGRWAVMATDFLQSIILFSITILMCILALVKVGGIGAFLDFFSDPRFATDFAFINEPGHFETDRFSMKWMIVIYIMAVTGQISFNSVERFLSAKDGAEARKGALLACILMAIGGIVWFIPPMVARFLYESEVMSLQLSNPTDASYAYIAARLLPNGLMGVMIAAMFAATMSSLDTGLNGQTGNIVKNMLPPLLRKLNRPVLSAGQEVITCKVVTVLLGACIILSALAFSTAEELILFDAFLLINSIIGLPLAFPLLIAVYVKKVPGWSYFVIFAFCLIPSFWSFWDSYFYDRPWTIQHRSMMILIFGLVSTIICRLLYSTTSEDYRAKTEEFFQRMRTPVDFVKEIGASNTYEQLNVVGKAVLITGMLLHFLLLLPNGLWGRVGILFVAWFITGAGALLIVGARVEQRAQAKTAALARASGSANAEDRTHED